MASTDTHVIDNAKRKFLDLTFSYLSYLPSDILPGSGEVVSNLFIEFQGRQAYQTVEKIHVEYKRLSAQPIKLVSAPG